jgi:hypothetical protein
MPIRDELRSVLELQRAYSSDVTPEMQQRGEIIRKTLPARLTEATIQLQSAADIAPGNLLIEGKDGITRKSRVPWVRFADESRSPSASQGWYVVWLFREDGAGVYLALSHASTKNINGNFIDRSNAEAARLMTWARGTFATEIHADQRLIYPIALGIGRLAKGYKRTTVAAYYYAFDSIPEDEQLLADMSSMAKLLGQLYGSERLGLIPDEATPEIIDAIVAVEKIASPRRSSRQGFGLSPAERIAVELRAMRVATQHLEGLGYEVSDTSRNRSYDLEASQGDLKLIVEVKGTTGLLGEIILTRNEVAHHLKHFPANALIVVHEIQLGGTKQAPVATGGTLRTWIPWEIDQSQLEPICFSYHVPK